MSTLKDIKNKTIIKIKTDYTNSTKSIHQHDNVYNIQNNSPLSFNNLFPNNNYFNNDNNNHNYNHNSSFNNMEKKNRNNSTKFTNINFNIFGNEKNFMINKTSSNRINNPNQSGKELSKHKLGNMLDFSPLKNSMTINKIKTPNKSIKINHNLSNSVYNIKQFSNNISDINKNGINPFDLGNNKLIVKSNIKIQEKEINKSSPYDKSKKLIYFF